MRPLGQEIALSLTGVVRLIARDPAALTMFNATPTGFWRSFMAAVLLLPLLLVRAGFAYAQFDTAPPLALYIPVELLMLALGWLTFPLIMLYVSGWLNRREQLLVYLVPYNWLQVFFTMATLIGVVMVGPDLTKVTFIASLFNMAVIAAFFFYQTDLAKQALNIPTHTAFAVVILDTLSSVFIMFTLNGHFYGPYLPAGS